MPDRSWNAIDMTQTPNAFCDGSLMPDHPALAALGSEATGGFCELDRSLPGKLFGHLVITLRNHDGTNTEVVDKLLASVSDRQIRLLVPIDGGGLNVSSRSVVGVVIQSGVELSSVADNGQSFSGQILYIDRFEFAQSDVKVLEDIIASQPNRYVIFSGLAGECWRMATLFACRFANVYLDTANLGGRRLRSMFSNRYQLGRLLNGLSSRIVFASGYPLGNPLKSYEVLSPWIGTKERRDALFRDNGLGVYGFHDGKDGRLKHNCCERALYCKF